MLPLRLRAVLPLLLPVQRLWCFLFLDTAWAEGDDAGLSRLVSVGLENIDALV